MLQLAARLCDAAGLAVETRLASGERRLQPLADDRAAVLIRSVRVGPATASAGLLLARLLAEASVPIIGEAVKASTIARKAVVAVDHDWRVILVVGEMRVVGAATKSRAGR